MTYLPLSLFLVLLPFALFAQTEEDVFYLGGNFSATVNFQDNSFFEDPDELRMRGGYFLTPQILLGADFSAGLDISGRFFSDNTFSLAPFARYYFLGDLDRNFRPFVEINAFNFTQRQIDVVVGGAAGAEWKVRPGIVGTVTLGYRTDLNEDNAGLVLRAAFNTLLNRRNNEPASYRNLLPGRWLFDPRVIDIQRLSFPGNDVATLTDVNFSGGLVLDRFLLEGRIEINNLRLNRANSGRSRQGFSVVELGGRYLQPLRNSLFVPFLGAKLAYTQRRIGRSINDSAFDLVISGGTFVFLHESLAVDAGLEYRNGLLSSPVSTRFGGRLGLKIFLGRRQP